MLARIYNFEEIGADGYKIRELAVINAGATHVAHVIYAAVHENPLKKAVAIVLDLYAGYVLGEALASLRIDFMIVSEGDDRDTQQRKHDEALNAHGQFVLIVSESAILSDKIAH